jgi:meiotic recombination protein SPO11
MMGPDEFEDMLYGFPSSQDSVGDDRNDAPEDDMLENILYLDSDQRQTYVDAVLTPPASHLDPDADMLDGAEDCTITASQNDQANVASSPRKDREWVIARIESMFEKMLDALIDDNEELSFDLSTRAGTTRRKRNLDGGELSIPPTRSRKVTFPGANAQEAWRFTVLTSILDLIHGCLVDNVVMTKRDIYYRHPDLFVTQSVVDRYVDDLACTFGVPRAMLNVTAAAKGLAAGNFIIWRDEGTHVHGLDEKEVCVHSNRTIR